MKRKVRLLLAVCIALLCTGVSWARKTVVWDSPAIAYGTNNGDGFFNLSLDVTRVELREDETVLHMTIRLRSDCEHDFWFAPDTRLRADGKSYAVVSAEGLELGKPFRTNEDAELEAVFHFKPVPRDTKSIDFLEGSDGFRIEGIRPAEECRNLLLPSYWRNDATGDWTIAFMEDFAIYDCRFWQYGRCDVDPKTGKAEMVLRNGDEQLTVSVGKDRKGKREMWIGGNRLVCSMLTGRFVPDYPVSDTRTDFADSGFRTDTVTVSGWLKDMPENYRQQRTFDFMYSDIFSILEKRIVVADLDEQGRFTVKIPVTNSTEFSCDWGRCFVRTMLEPGKTYFMLYDFKEGRRYFMGSDARLQNELFRFPMDWNSVRMKKNGNFNNYIVSVDSLLKMRFSYIDSLCAAHPSLSTRFKAYRKGCTLWQQACDFGQARFFCKGLYLPDNARKYAREMFWDKLPSQLTMHRGIGWFLLDYLSDVANPAPVVLSVEHVRNHIAKLASNDSELALFTRWVALADTGRTLINAAPTMEEKVNLAVKLYEDSISLISQVKTMMEGDRMRDFVNTLTAVGEMRDFVHYFDSLQAVPAIRNIWLCHLVFNRIDQNNHSLPAAVIDTLRTLVDNPLGVETVEKRNLYFQALERREFDKLVLKSSADLQGISEGKSLLQKILEPFRGKMVLLDVWGTWCRPCREALKNSTEEYARLSKYDIAYVYLANNSPQESWENMIKMYNVSGDNVAHYNLPYEQQMAIESYLNVNSFPTYKLFDRDGNLLDVKVDARSLESLVHLLKNF